MQTYFKVRKLKIRELFGSSRNRKSANNLGVPVRKSQIRKFLCGFNPLIASPQIVHLRTSLTKLGFLTAIFHFSFFKIMFFRVCWSLKSANKTRSANHKSANHKNNGSANRKSQVATFAEGSWTQQIFQVRIFADLRFAKFTCGDVHFCNMYCRTALQARNRTMIVGEILGI